MRKNKFQVAETYISNTNGLEVKAWNVVDSQDEYVVETFDVKADAKYFASKWSKQNSN